MELFFTENSRLGHCENYSRRAPINRKAVWLLYQLERKEYIKVWKWPGNGLGGVEICSCFKLQNLLVNIYQLDKDAVVHFFVWLTLSQEGRGLLQPPPPLSDFPSYHFCVFTKIAVRRCRTMCICLIRAKQFP